MAASTNELPKDLNNFDYDIDFFVYGVDKGQTMKIITKICDSIKDIIPESKSIKTSKTVTIMMPKPYINLQFITTLFNDKNDILYSFDLQSSKVLFDGNTVWTTIEGHFGYHHNTNIYMLENINGTSYETRLKKYSSEYRKFVSNDSLSSLRKQIMNVILDLLI